jgi:hypothetical protein
VFEDPPAVTLPADNAAPATPARTPNWTANPVLWIGVKSNQEHRASDLHGDAAALSPTRASHPEVTVGSVTAGSGHLRGADGLAQTRHRSWTEGYKPLMLLLRMHLSAARPTGSEHPCRTGAWYPSHVLVAGDTVTVHEIGECAAEGPPLLGISRKLVDLPI